jgi:hypothetical protein
MTTDTAKIFELFSDGQQRFEDRLNERHKRIIDANIDAIADKTVIDLAASNGRWSYAAIRAGAKNVLSIEGRPDRADQAREYFDQLGVADRIDADTGDMYAWLQSKSKVDVDTVFCLGIFYHVMDHYMLIRLIADLRPRSIIIDSGFVRSFRNSVRIISENPNLYSNALSVHDGQSKEVVGVVSLGLMIQMAWNIGYNCRPVLWDTADIQNKTCVHDYITGRRFTLRLDKIEGNHDPEWKEHWTQALTALDPRFAGMLDKEFHDDLVDDTVKHPFDSMEYSIF